MVFVNVIGIACVYVDDSLSKYFDSLNEGGSLTCEVRSLEDNSEIFAIDHAH